MYYPCSEKKGADRLRSYFEADLRLCFRRLLVFSRGSSFVKVRLSTDCKTDCIMSTDCITERFVNLAYPYNYRSWTSFLNTSSLTIRRPIGTLTATPFAPVVGLSPFEAFTFVTVRLIVDRLSQVFTSVHFN